MTMKGKRHGMKWTEEEDELLKGVVDEQKPRRENLNDWKQVAKKIPGRSYGACQGRWNCFLDPNIDRSEWTDESDVILKGLVKKNDETCNTWSKRGKLMKRSGADVCSRWFYLKKQKRKFKDNRNENVSEEELHQRKRAKQDEHTKDSLQTKDDTY